ncbi:LysR family transcriptional regulator, partial [Thermodesulfobacteriota bacterium]
MDLKKLETFYYFCQFMSMTRTAQHLNVSQPAVSQQLSGFEEACGVKLFFREANKYKLTETGEDMYLVCKRVFSRLGQMETILEKARKAGSNRLWIGTTKAYARTLMPDLIAKFQREFPSVHMRLSEGNSADLISRLRNRKEDLVVVARSKYDSSLRPIPFAKAEFVLVARPDHPLAQGTPVSIQSLGGESLIIREQGSGSRQAILEKLERFGVKPSVVMESESLSFILAYIERRMGVSFILSREVDKELAEGTLKQINLTEGNISFIADIVTRRNEPLSVPMRNFIRIVKKRRDVPP